MMKMIKMVLVSIEENTIAHNHTSSTPTHTHYFAPRVTTTESTAHGLLSAHLYTTAV